MTIAFDNGVSGQKCYFFGLYMQPIAMLFFALTLSSAGPYKTIIADMRLLIALPESCASFIDASVQLQQCCHLSSALPHYNYCRKNKTHSAVNSRRVQLSINNNRNDFISQWVRSRQTLFVPNPPN